MAQSDTTRWSLIASAAAGDAAAREEFARRYDPIVRAYLGARWSHEALFHEIDDAAQEVFLDCFKENGALGRAENGREGGFRAFLYGIARNVALRVERRRARAVARPTAEDLDAVAADADGASTAFDRAWATALLEEARRRYEARAKSSGEAALFRVDLLRLRFEEGMPIRDIARLRGVAADRLHHEYATAREEFREALLEAAAAEHPGAARGELERECARLLALLRK